MKQFEPPSGTRDFLAPEVEGREAAFATIRRPRAAGFEPLQTPAFERLETLTGKYGEEGDKSSSRSCAGASRRPAARPTWPCATTSPCRWRGSPPSTAGASRCRISATRSPRWRADRLGKGRFREFTQCDLDIVGSSSPLADAEIVCALADVLDELGVPEFTFPGQLPQGPDQAARGLPGPGGARSRDPDHPRQARQAQPRRGGGRAGRPRPAGGHGGGARRRPQRPGRGEEDPGHARVQRRRPRRLDEVDQLLRLVEGQIPAERISFSPRLVRGLEYYTGVIFEIVAPGVPGSIASGGATTGSSPGSAGRTPRPAAAPSASSGSCRCSASGRRASAARTSPSRSSARTSPPTPSGWRPACAGPLRAVTYPRRQRQARPPAHGRVRPGRPLRRDPRPRRARRGRGHHAGHGERRADPDPARPGARWVPRA